MTDSGELQPGAMVTPSIRLQRLLGRGGMGSVWIADHLQLKTQVVVKFMTAERAESDEAKQRFQREAELAAQAKHPHVVQIFDHGISQLGVPYIAMELLEGEDLGKRITREGAIDPKTFSRWLTQACRGMGRAHAKGIVHRDIKPENIFLCEEEGEVLVKVLDFGVAKEVMGSSGLLSTRTGAILGTAYYMSPEQTMGRKDIDHRSDLWSLAVVAFYALTGARPFKGDGIGQVVLAITTDPLPLLSQHNPAFGPRLDAWMTKALARSREERFQSAKELAQGLALALDLSEAGRNDSGQDFPRAEKSATVSDPALSASDLGLAATTMSPSVSGGAERASVAGSAEAARTGRSWLFAVLGGAALGLLAVIAVSLSSKREASPLPSAPVVAAMTVPAEAPAAAPVTPPTEDRTAPAAEPSASSAAASAPALAARPPVAPKRAGTVRGQPSSAPAPSPAAVPEAPKPQPKNPLDMEIQ